jgi:hypothetical protein
MPFLRNVLKDLVEKRLWPVALLLVGALVAAPMLLGRSAGDSAAPATPGSSATANVAGAGGTASKAAVTLETDPSDAEHTAGKVRDPFRAPKAKAKKATNADAATPAATPAPTAVTGGTTTSAPDTSAPSGSSSTGSSSTGTTSTGSAKPKTTTKPKTTAPKAEDAKDTYHVSLRISTDGGELKTIRDVARLSPLPSVTDPFFAFLGVIETKTTHEKRAVFVVSSDVTPLGDGSCHPTKQDCESVELANGDSMYFSYTKPDGTPGQYELQLAGIHKTEVTSQAKAAAAIARHSVAGAELLRDAATRNVRAAGGARAYRYLPAVGLLVRAKRAKVTAKAAAAGEVPGMELVDRKHQPGLPVWHSPKK